MNPSPHKDDDFKSHRPKWVSPAMVLICMALLALFATLSWQAEARKSPTFDEPLHFTGAWAETQLGDFRFNPEDPPLFKRIAMIGMQTIPLRISEPDSVWKILASSDDQRFLVVHDVLLAPANDLNRAISSAGNRMLLLGILLGAAIAWSAWKLKGPLAAVIATAAFSFDPNFIAHASLVKDDVAISLAFLGLTLAIWFVGERITILRVISVGLLSGVALSTKFSGILAIPILITALTIRAMLPQPWPLMRRSLTTRWTRTLAASGICAIAVGLSLVCLWACYRFRFDPSADPSSPYKLSNSAPSNILGVCILWADKHRLLPQAWLYGLAYTYRESRNRSAFLLGRFGDAGWWFYFPLAMLFKIPLASLIAFTASAGVGLIAFIRSMRRDFSRAAPRSTSLLFSKAWPAIVFLLTPTLYMAEAMQSKLNIGVRHVFPVYAFLFIMAGVAMAFAIERRPKITIAVCLALLLGIARGATLAAFPDYISFFNVAAGGSRGGLRLLSDSNLDWGQDLPLLAAWQQQHPGQQLYLCYFGSDEPARYGIHYLNLPGSEALQPQKTASTLPGVIAISATHLQGTYLSAAQRKMYLPLRKSPPLAVLGGSIYLFDASVLKEGTNLPLSPNQ